MKNPEEIANEYPLYKKMELDEQLTMISAMKEYAQEIARSQSTRNKKDGEVAVLPSDGEIINKIDLLTDNQANFANEKGLYSPSRAFDTLTGFIKWTRTARQ